MRKNNAWRSHRAKNSACSQSQSAIPHNSCGISQNSKKGLASVTWKKIYSRLNGSLILPNKAENQDPRRSNLSQVT